VAHVKGTYAIILHLGKNTVITVGKLGDIPFTAGYYLYIGSALNSLFPRIERHVRGSNRLHWHVDYLRQEAGVIEVWYLVSDERLECTWYRIAIQMPTAPVPVSGFGSSGCRCQSHLLYFPSVPSIEDFRLMVGDAGKNLVRCEYSD